MKKDSATREQRILDAARQNFGRYGFKKTTIADVARDAGVGKGTIYLHFGGKEEILFKVVEREYMRELTHVMGKIAGKSDPVEKLRTLIEEAYSYTKDNEFLRLVISGAPELFTGLPREAFDRIQDQGIALISALIEEGMDTGAFRRVDANKVAYILLNVDRALQYDMFLGWEKYKGDELVDTVIDLVMDGIRGE